MNLIYLLQETFWHLNAHFEPTVGLGALGAGQKASDQHKDSNPFYWVTTDFEPRVLPLCHPNPPNPWLYRDLPVEPKIPVPVPSPVVWVTPNGAWLRVIPTAVAGGAGGIETAQYRHPYLYASTVAITTTEIRPSDKSHSLINQLTSKWYFCFRIKAIQKRRPSWPRSWGGLNSRVAMQHIVIYNNKSISCSSRHIWNMKQSTLDATVSCF